MEKSIGYITSIFDDYNKEILTIKLDENEKEVEKQAQDRIKAAKFAALAGEHSNKGLLAEQDRVKFKADEKVKRENREKEIIRRTHSKRQGRKDAPSRFGCRWNRKPPRTA